MLDSRVDEWNAFLATGECWVRVRRRKQLDSPRCAMASCPRKYDLKRRFWSLSLWKIRDLFMFFKVSANGKLWHTGRATFLWTFSTFSHRHFENKLGLRCIKMKQWTTVINLSSDLLMKLSRFLAKYCYEILNFAGAMNYATFKMILHETFDVFR